MKYAVAFSGKTKGAIGINYFIRLIIEAESAEAAILKVYETHDPYYTPVAREFKELGETK
jgi:hypothetical protein